MLSMFIMWLVGAHHFRVGANLVECGTWEAAMVRWCVARILLARHVGCIHTTILAKPRFKVKAMYIDGLHYIPL
jgi:hypothetical protein